MITLSCLTLMAAIRPASHSGSWYSANKRQLQTQIENWFSTVDSPRLGRFGVGPHAGYTYCGATLAHTYKCLDPSITTVFIMGPSHYEYFKGVRMSFYAGYETPLGTVAVEKEIVRKLNDQGVEFLDMDVDDEEHSLEMHLPMLKYANPEATFVPLVFGDLSPSAEQEFVQLLAPYFDNPKIGFIVSSDFCHWGSRFGYTRYSPSGTTHLAPVKQHSSPLGRPIWESIRDLDQEGMDIASTGNADSWNKYIQETGNTVCGNRPLSVLIRLAETCNNKIHLEWLHYAQSSHVSSRHDSSVSYAAAIA